MKLSDLNKITATDIKSYDWRGLKFRLLGDPWPLYCIAGVLLALFAINFARGVHKDIKIARKTEISDLKKQVDAVKSYEATESKYNKFVSTIPEYISDSDLVKRLSEIALRHNVQIVSFTPPKKQGSTNIEITSVEIKITSESYENAIRFMHNIEESEFSVRVSKWYGFLANANRSSRQSSRRRIKSPSGGNYIEATMEIQTVKFKYD